MRIAFEHAIEVFGSDYETYEPQRNIPALLAAVALAHDLGNPPFGHQGEIAIRNWFNESAHEQLLEHQDFARFDGNAQTFRLVTRLQVLNDEFGLNLTVATLAAMMKYPSLHDSLSLSGYSKFGIFESERGIANEVWKHTGLAEGQRHPFAYVVEACDDIAYSVIDAEDTVKKAYASFYDLMDYLESESGGDSRIDELVSSARSKNEEFRKEKLSLRELNDISMQMFRVKAIAIMVVDATDSFVKHVNEMMDCSIEKGFELIANSQSGRLCNVLKRFDRVYGFQHNDVLELELKGNNYIHGIMDLLWPAIYKEADSRNAYERYAYGTLSENYRRVFETSKRKCEEEQELKYHAQRLLSDAVSGMTEPHLIDTYERLKGLQHAGD